MANLADLMEDEKIPPFMPMVVRVNNSDITLRVRGLICAINTNRLMGVW